LKRIVNPIRKNAAARLRK